jgi:phytoene desaturase
MIDKSYASLGAMVKSLPGLVMRRAERSVYKLVSKYIRNEQLRQALSFHPLFIGGNPMRSSGVLSLISYLEREYGVHYAKGGTHSLVKGHCRADRRAGGHDPHQCGSGRNHCREWPRHWCPASRRAGHSGFHRGFQCRCRLDLFETAAKHPRKRWTDAKIGRAKYSMSLFRLVFRREPEI